MAGESGPIFHRPGLILWIEPFARLRLHGGSPDRQDARPVDAFHGVAAMRPISPPGCFRGSPESPVGRTSCRLSRFALVPLSIARACSSAATLQSAKIRTDRRRLEAYLRKWTTPLFSGLPASCADSQQNVPAPLHFRAPDPGTTGASHQLAADAESDGGRTEIVFRRIIVYPGGREEEETTAKQIAPPASHMLPSQSDPTDDTNDIK